MEHFGSKQLHGGVADALARLKDANVHGLHVQIDPAVVLVLVVVESHRSSSCANVRTIPATSLLTTSRGRGRAV